MVCVVANASNPRCCASDSRVCMREQPHTHSRNSHSSHSHSLTLARCGEPSSSCVSCAPANICCGGARAACVLCVVCRTLLVFVALSWCGGGDRVLAYALYEHDRRCRCRRRVAARAPNEREEMTTTHTQTRTKDDDDDDDSDQRWMMMMLRCARRKRLPNVCECVQ